MIKGEFRSLTSLLKDTSIIHRVPCPHASKQNGVAKPKH